MIINPGHRCTIAESARYVPIRKLKERSVDTIVKILSLVDETKLLLLMPVFESRVPQVNSNSLEFDSTQTYCDGSCTDVHARSSSLHTQGRCCPSQVGSIKTGAFYVEAI